MELRKKYRRWSYEDIERLKIYAARNWSARQIAVQFGVTQSAITGLCNREGIKLYGYDVRTYLYLNKRG